MVGSILDRIRDEYNNSNQRPFNIDQKWLRSITLRTLIDDSSILTTLIKEGLSLKCDYINDNFHILEQESTSSECLTMLEFVEPDDREYLIGLAADPVVIQAMSDKGMKLHIDSVLNCDLVDVEDHLNVAQNCKWLTEPLKIDDSYRLLIMIFKYLQLPYQIVESDEYMSVRQPEIDSITEFDKSDIPSIIDELGRDDVKTMKLLLLLDSKALIRLEDYENDNSLIKRLLSLK